MYGFLLTLIVLDGIFLSVVILLQAGKGGGLAAMGGGGAGTMTEGVLAGRQATTMLTRATWTAGTVFMVLALILSIMSSRAQQAQSVIEVDTPTSAPAPEPVLPGVQGGDDEGAPAGAPVGGVDTTGN